MELMDHVQLGRVCYLESQIDGNLRILLVDDDNDGTFEGAPLVGSFSYFTQLGLDTYEDWDAFMHP